VKDLKVLGFKSSQINQRHTNLLLFAEDFAKKYCRFVVKMQQ
jgi:hypothetical protein